MLRTDVADIKARIDDGTANRGDSVSYATRSLGLKYAEAAYLHIVDENKLHYAEQFARTLGKTGGLPTEPDLKAIAAELGTPFFKVETSEAGRRIEVLNLTQVPFDHVVHLQPTLLTYSYSTPSGRVTTQIILPGSFQLIANHLGNVGFPASALLPGSGKASADPGTPWVPGMPTPLTVPNCAVGEDPYVIVHPEYGSYYSCAITVTGVIGGSPAPGEPITCIICSEDPSPLLPVHPGYPWPPAAPNPTPDPVDENGGFNIQANTQVGHANPVKEGSGGSKYRFYPKIGYQMNPYGYAPLHWLNVASVVSSYEAILTEVYATRNIEYTTGISAALKSAGFNVGISQSVDQQLSTRTLAKSSHTYQSPGQFGSYELNMSTACAYPQVSTSLRVKNDVTGSWYFYGDTKSGQSAGESSSSPMQCGYVQ